MYIVYMFTYVGMLIRCLYILELHALLPQQCLHQPRVMLHYRVMAGPQHGQELKVICKFQFSFRFLDQSTIVNKTPAVVIEIRDKSYSKSLLSPWVTSWIFNIFNNDRSRKVKNAKMSLIYIFTTLFSLIIDYYYYYYWRIIRIQLIIQLELEPKL